MEEEEEEEEEEEIATQTPRFAPLQVMEAADFEAGQQLRTCWCTSQDTSLTSCSGHVVSLAKTRRPAGSSHLG